MQLCSLCLLLMCWGHWRRGGVFILDNASGGAGALGETAQGLTLEAGSQQTALNLLGVRLNGGSSSGGRGGGWQFVLEKARSTDISCARG